MSSNMAASTKTIKVLTSYKQHELKLVKVQIRRHNIKETNNAQPLERDLINPDSVSSIVHMTGTEYGLLFRKITPNTIQLPQEAYHKASKAAVAKQKAAPPPEAAPCRQRSASCSSEEETNKERRSRSSEKHRSSDTGSSVKQKRRSPDAEPGTKRKSTRSPSRSPPAKSSHRRQQHSPSHSPHSPRRSKSPSSSGKERVRNLSTKKGIFVPDKSGRPSRVRDRHSYSKSPSPSSHRHSSSRHRRRSRDDSRDRHRHSSRSTSSEGRRNSSRDRHRNSSQRRSKDRHSEDRRSDFVEQAEFYHPRGHPHFNPNLLHAAPPPMIYPPMQPFFQTFPQFFNRQFYPPQEQAFGQFRPRKKLPVYNSRKIPNFLAATPNGTPGAAPSSTITSNGAGAPGCNGDTPLANPGANGIA